MLLLLIYEEILTKWVLDTLYVHCRTESKCTGEQIYVIPISLQGDAMNNIIWWVGFIVILLVVLGFFGLR